MPNPAACGLGCEIYAATMEIENTVLITDEKLYRAVEAGSGMAMRLVDLERGTGNDTIGH